MSPRLTPGFAPWRPLLVAKLPELEDELRLELGPIRARTLALHLADDDAGPRLTATVTTGDPDHRATERVLRAWVDPIVETIPGLRFDVVFGARPTLRSVP